MKNSVKRVLLGAFEGFLFFLGVSAQTIRGTVTDATTNEPIPYATIVLTNSEGVGTVTDIDGQFVLKAVPIGRYNVKASYVGYVPSIFQEILVSSAKEVCLDFALKEDVQKLNEVVIKPHISKEISINMMALTGAKMLSVEEASRYAGGFDDPARLVSSFSGVSTGGDRNGISVHGYSPHLLQWRLEDVEIPTPSHFADAYVVGGGLVSALSAQVMGNSDFMSAAFPAEYGNALSGVFDIKLRHGNNQQYEHTFQAGTLGFEGASEGPINKKRGSSYLINYRYSFIDLAGKMGLIPLEGGDVINYQDLNFKLDFPTRRLGNFSVFGLGLANHTYADVETPDRWENTYDQENADVKQIMGVLGASHKYRFLEKGTLSTSLAVSYSRNKMFEEYYMPIGNTQNTYPVPYAGFLQENTNILFHTAYNRKLGNRFTYKTGIDFTRYFFNLDMSLAPYIGADQKSVYFVNDATNMMSLYGSASWAISSKFTFNFGLNGQLLTLNDNYTIEPRASIKWEINPTNSISFGYGLHSRLEKMDVLFVKDDEGKPVNKDLGFTKAHHFILNYTSKISDNLCFKTDVYYHHLFDVPVGADDSFSVLNRNDYYVDRALVNEGKGRNYGIDFTLEKYLSDGLYYMINTSFFKSEYCGGDGKWYNTRFNRGYMLKALGGKEWMMGKNKRDILSVNLKVTYQGGLRYSPYDWEATLNDPENNPDWEVIYDETRAFTEQFDPELLIDYTISYKRNCAKTSHEFAVKWLNATNSKVFIKHVYNYKKERIEPYDLSYSFPNICYKINF